MLKEAVPSASKVAFLEMRTDSAANEQQLQEAGRRLEISVIDKPLQESTPSEYQRVFSEIEQERPDAIIVSTDGAFIPYRQLIVELAEKSRLPAMYGSRYYPEVGG
jgi:putative ABC transport system substrate-binding protein